MSDGPVMALDLIYDIRRTVSTDDVSDTEISRNRPFVFQVVVSNQEETGSFVVDNKYRTLRITRCTVLQYMQIDLDTPSLFNVLV